MTRRRSTPVPLAAPSGRFGRRATSADFRRSHVHADALGTSPLTVPAQAERPAQLVSLHECGSSASKRDRVEEKSACASPTCSSSGCPLVRHDRPRARPTLAAGGGGLRKAIDRGLWLRRPC